MAQQKKPKRAAPAAQNRAGAPGPPAGRGQASRRPQTRQGSTAPPRPATKAGSYGPPPGQRRRVRRKRRGRRTLHYLLLIIFVVAAGVILSLTVFFKIESVQVIGIDRYQPDDIIGASGIEIGDNLLKLDADMIEEEILKKFPYIESVAVQRRFPPRVELVVTQSVPAYAIYLGDEVALLTENGKLLEQGGLLVPPELPIVKGLALEGFSPGERLGGEGDQENEERLRMLHYFAQAAEKTGFGPITNVDVTDRLNMTTVYEARLLVVLGSESDLEYKLTFLQEVIADLGAADQARLDASNARDKRVLVKWGKVEKGVFTPLEDAGPEIIMGAGTTEEPSSGG